MDTIGSAASSVVNSVKSTVHNVTAPPASKAPLETTHSVETTSTVKSPPPPVQKTPEMLEKEELVAQATQKLLSYKELSSALPGGNNTDPVSAIIANAKIELGENSTKLQKQTLMLENEIQEVKTHNAEIKEFISKNAGKEVTKDNIDDFVDVKEEDHKSILDEVKIKEGALEDTLAQCKKLYRKKTIDLSTYLETVRELSEEQFLNLAMREKILALMTTIHRP
mmetsp:Transcript_12162/g.12162  ORF Transcript_12162/g.12162 Transcript_12162/m.12162 type:complete len:224 (+) Transcript_12162:493-1164(+)|eukprot:CAMPEP_0197007944 /NCGR_PEP_ID=MMETSP1380-20130617/43007_1 /TAXON_ID=5936 /ORGANISM="Euplotes crassus, Strain CT5" /LENGTH=223 /DNA_ID=CAMNT_0042428273 /DNA_START=485 /DNA_END=1156 /DNA_ORIENTATION=+